LWGFAPPTFGAGVVASQRPIAYPKRRQARTLGEMCARHKKFNKKNKNRIFMKIIYK
jgi:hypothetical protein